MANENLNVQEKDYSKPLGKKISELTESDITDIVKNYSKDEIEDNITNTMLWSEDLNEQQKDRIFDILTKASQEKMKLENENKDSIKKAADEIEKKTEEHNKNLYTTQHNYNTFTFSTFFLLARWRFIVRKLSKISKWGKEKEGGKGGMDEKKRNHARWVASGSEADRDPLGQGIQKRGNSSGGHYRSGGKRKARERKLSGGGEKREKRRKKEKGDKR